MWGFIEGLEVESFHKLLQQEGRGELLEQYSEGNDVAIAGAQTRRYHTG